MHGYREFYRKDGVIMRSGHFDKDENTGGWTAYGKAGKVYKAAKMKSK